MLIKLFDKKNFENFSPRESRLVFLLDEIGGGLGKLAEGVGHVAYTAGDLVELVTSGTKEGVKYIKEGATWAKEKAQGVHESNIKANLPEYSALKKIKYDKCPSDEEDADSVNKALEYQAKLILLAAAKAEYNNFYKKAFEQYKITESFIKNRREVVNRNKDRMDKHKARIAKIERALKSGKLKKHQQAPLKISLQQEKSALAILEAQCSYTMRIPRPRLMLKVFPKDSRNHAPQYQSHKTDMIDVDARSLYRFLAVHLVSYANQLKHYNDQIKVLRYQTEKIMAPAKEKDDDALEHYQEQRGKMKKIYDSIMGSVPKSGGFKTVTGSKPLPMPAFAPKKRPQLSKAAKGKYKWMHSDVMKMLK